MIDLHKLANTPGYGKATAAVKKAGYWDEYEGLSYSKYKVEYSVSMRGEIEVKARSEAEVMEIAAKEIAETHDCEEYDVEINEVEESK